METLDEIWADDLFERRQEAENLVSYLRSATAWSNLRSEGSGLVFAIDSGYGQGKSFFLRRLDRHLKSTSHISAFIDAWADDLEDDPLIALAATLDEALHPWTEKSPRLAAHVAEFRAKAGRVSGIILKGLAKRALGFVITQTAADLLSEELSSIDEVRRDLQKDAISDISEEIVNNSARLFDKTDKETDIELRISRFHEAKAAIKEMRLGLSKVVNTIKDEGLSLPITVIIDELDRCRPTYALKLLEELKHLFDVPGVAFVLGLHGKQLSHSISAAYGEQFDGRSYLRRFFNRRYQLKDASLAPLVKKLLNEWNTPIDRMKFPQVIFRGEERLSSISPEELIASSMISYGLSARDVFTVIEMINTSMTLIDPNNVALPYLLSLIYSHILSQGDRSEIISRPNWLFAKYLQDRSKSDVIGIELDQFCDYFRNYSKMNTSQFIQIYNRNDNGLGAESVAAKAAGDFLIANTPHDSLSHLSQYNNLIHLVSNFNSA